MIKASNQAWGEFYHHLAYLFYAVTDADHHIHQDEVKALHTMVVQDWLDVEDSSDEFGTDNAFQIEIFFDLIREKDLYPEKAFQKFEQYYHENPRFFTAEIVQRIYRTCGKIASAFHQINQQEMAMLDRVQLLLGKISHDTQ